MSNHTHAATKQHGSDSDGLNLPSFRDLVSFQRPDAYADPNNARTPARPYREHFSVAAPPRRPPEESFEVIGVKRAAHRPSPPDAPQSSPHLDRQGSRREWTQSEVENHRLTQGHRAPSRSHHDGFPSHYSPREASYRNQHSGVHDGYRSDQVTGSSRSDRLNPEAASRQGRIMQEGAPTSQEMIRSSKADHSVVYYPSSRLSNCGEKSYVSGQTRNVKNEERSSSTQAIPSQGPTASARILPPEQQYYREHRSLDHLVERSLSASPQFVHTSRSSALSSSLHQTASPSLPAPRNQARMFDYSCARLPTDSRQPSASTSMGPPSSSMSTHRGITSSTHHFDQARERDFGHQRMSSHAQASYTIEHGEYQQRPVYDGRSGDPSGSPAGRAPEVALRGQLQGPERAQLEKVGAVPRTVPPVERRNADPTRHRDHPSSQAEPFHQGYVTRSSPDQRGGHRSDPVRQQQLVNERGVIVSSSDPTRLPQSMSEREHASHSLVRHRDDTRLPRASPTAHPREFQDHRQAQRERMEVEHMRAVQQQNQRAQYHSRSEELHRRNAVFEERSRAEHGLHSQARFQPQPQNMTAPSPRPDRREYRLVRSSETGPIWEDETIEKKVAYHVEDSRVGGQRREPAFERKPSSVDQSFLRQDYSHDLLKESAFPPRNRPAEDYRQADQARNRYPAPSRAATPGHEQLPSRAVVHDSGVPRSDHRMPSERVYYIERPAQHSARVNVDQMHRSPSQASLLSERGVEADRPRNSPADNVKVSSGQHQDYHEEQSPSTHDDAVDRGRLPHSDRAQPPVIASQHTSLQPRNGVVQHLSAPLSAPSRPLKRHRADSDTSLVLKTSRFAMVDAEDELSKARSSRVVLPSPPRPIMQRESVQRQRHEQSDTSSQARPAHASESPAKSVNGSAPITPPLSSN